MSLLKYILLFITICFLTGCSESHRKSADRILKDLSKSYIEKYEMDFINTDSAVKETDSLSQMTIVIRVQQWDDYRGNRRFSIYYSDGLIPGRDKPTEIFQYKGWYVAMFIKNRKPISKRDIPTFLFSDRDYFTHEGSRTVLICKNSNRYIAVDDEHATPLELIVQLQLFDCNRKVRGLPLGTVENAIVDTTIKVTVPVEPKSF